MPFNNDIKVLIQDGGIGRIASGKDFYTGIVFQSATKPSEYGSNDIERIYSLAEAVALGITQDDYPVLYYQISEYFRLLTKWNFNGLLDVMFADIATGSFDGDEIQTMQINAEGELRQIGVFLVDPYVDTFITNANTVCGVLDSEGTPVSVFIAADIADISAISDQRTLECKWVTPLAAMDGGGEGYDLYTSEGYSVACLGAALASCAYAKVHESLGWVGKFDISGGTELQVLALADGQLISTKTPAEIDAINDKGLMIAVKRRREGSYFYDAPTATLATSDFAYLESVRTISKAKRLILQELAPLQNAPLYVNPSTGKLTEQTIAVFDTSVRTALNNLAINQEISVDPQTGRIPQNSIQINPDQNVLSTSKIVINVRIVPVGVARIIEVPLSFAVTV